MEKVGNYTFISSTNDDLYVIVYTKIFHATRLIIYKGTNSDIHGNYFGRKGK